MNVHNVCQDTLFLMEPVFLVTLRTALTVKHLISVHNAFNPKSPLLALVLFVQRIVKFATTKDNVQFVTLASK